MKRLAHAVVCDFAKIGEGGLGDYGAQLGMRVERLQQLRGSHGFAKAKDALGVYGAIEEVQPLMNVVSFEDAVGGQLASAGTVCAGIGEKYGVPVCEKKVGISDHTEAIVAETVKHNRGVSACIVWLQKPSTKGCVVGGGD